jgi:hypothetical protein
MWELLRSEQLLVLLLVLLVGLRLEEELGLRTGLLEEKLELRVELLVESLELGVELLVVSLELRRELLVASLGLRVELLVVSLELRVGLPVALLLEPRGSAAWEPGCKLFRGQSVAG